MPTVDIHVRLPSDVSKAVYSMARDDDSSFNREVIVLLREAIAHRREKGELLGTEAEETRSAQS